MIYGKIWCVVKPSVGIPLFLSAVAVGSFSVHLALVTHTTWVKRFLNGNAPAATAAAEAAPSTAAAAPPAVVAAAPAGK
jgi:light-harvesting protein B-800-850 alpha chain